MLLESAVMRLLPLLIHCFAVGKKEGKKKKKKLENCTRLLEEGKPDS